MAQADRRFKAFISYSHRDQAVAKWLHRALESYRIPKRLVGKETPRGVISRRLGAIFRDRDELPVSADLSGTINEALAATEFLVVLCSPSSAASQWVNQEVINFKRLKGADSIICVIAAGEPYASAIPGREAEECFAPALRFQVDADGAVTTTPAEPIAADLRKGKDGKRFAKLKVIAGLIGVGLDELVRRENQRRQRQTFAVACGAIAASVVMAVLTVNAFRANQDAQRQKDQAEALIEFMLTDLRDKLEPVGRLDVLDSVGEKALDYFATLRPDELDPDTLGRRARALHLLGEIQDFRGNLDQALKTFTEASQATEEMLARDSANPQRIFDHAQSKYWIGYIAYRRGDYDGAEASFRNYEALAQQLLVSDTNNPAWITELAHARHNLGVVEFARGDAAASIALLESGNVLHADAVARDPANPKWLNNLAQNAAWLADAHKRRGDLATAYKYRAQEGGIYEKMRADDPGNRRLTQNSLVAHGALGVLSRQSGDIESAQKHFLAALVLANELTALEAENTLWLELKGRALLDHADLLLDLNRRSEARASIAEAQEISRKLLATDPSVQRWRVFLDVPGQALAATLNLQEGAGKAALSSAQALLEKTQALTDGPKPTATMRAQRAQSLLLYGDAQQLVGNGAAAREAWQSSSDAFRALGDRLAVDYRLYFATALARLGRQEEAQSLVESLTAGGYRSPSIVRLREKIAALAR